MNASLKLKINNLVSTNRTIWLLFNDISCGRRNVDVAMEMARQMNKM
jgi:hypothetical protein